MIGYRGDVHDIMPILTASVSPSTTEAFGRPAAEAMACGTPAVVAATDGLKEIVVEGKTGFVVPANDPDKLSVALRKILSDRRARLEWERREDVASRKIFR